MMRIIYLILLLTLVATVPVLQPVSANAAGQDSALEQGRQLFEAGKSNQALAVLRNFVQQSSDTPETAQAYALIGRIFIRQNNYADALLYLQRIPDVLRSPEIDLLLGQSLVSTGQPAEGMRLLRPLLNEPLSLADKTVLLRSLTTAAIKQQQLLMAVFFLHQQLPISQNQAAILEQAHQLLQSRISDIDLAEAAFMLQGTAIGQDAQLQLARRALVRQQPEVAKRHLDKLFAASVTFPYWQEAQQLLQRTSGDNWLSRDSIGIMLPLSGRYASYGELIKKGLELALQEHNKTRLPIRFIYRDTALEGVSTAQLVSSLSDDDKVMAIIGPLLGAGAGDAARRAQREMIPMLSLSQSEGLPEIGNFIFRDTLTSAQQVKALVNYALANGNISFSILYPENRLGRQMTELFKAELQKAGGEIVDVIGYPEDSTDFKKQIEQLLWEDYAVARKAPENPEEELPELEYPLAPFHALFIPDYADRINLIAPQLVFYGIKNVTLLGINGWNSPELITRSGRFLQNAVFVDSFFPESGKPEARRFVDLYRKTYKDEPTILEAQAFDAANIMLQSMDDPQLSNREDLRSKLASLQNFRGVTGTRGFDLFGEAIKDLYLLQIRKNRIVETP